uniref:TIGR04139 family peptide modification target n=1 Tax=Strongyloides venezuelensis TaxID=75913 RepID=A0A0K0FW74_STRVS
MSRNLNETQVQLCNKTYSDKFGGLGGLTSIDKTGSELNGGGMNSTDYTYKNKTDSTSGGCFLRFTSYVNNSDPICTLFICGK